MRRLTSLYYIFIILLVISCAPAPVKKGPVVFYPPLPMEPRVQFLISIRGEDDLEVKQASFDAFLLGEEKYIKRIGRPYDIGTSKNRVYVSDRLYLKVLYFDLTDHTLHQLETSGAGTLSNPGGLWVTDDDTKYITDLKRKQVLVYDSKNQYIMAYGDSDVLSRPTDVAVYGNNIYVCDMTPNAIKVFDKNTGQITKEIRGPANNGMYKPTHITVDSKGNLFVTDSFKFRVMMFDPNGVFVKQIGSHGDSTGTFSRPKGIAVSKDGHLYAVDAAFENTQIFDVATGRILLPFGGVNGLPGDMGLPAGVHIGYHNVDYFQKFVDKDFKLKYLIYIGNLVGVKRLSVYGFGEWIGAPLPKM